MIQFHAWTEGWTERPYFIRHFQLPPGVQKKSCAKVKNCDLNRGAPQHSILEHLLFPFVNKKMLTI